MMFNDLISHTELYFNNSGVSAYFWNKSMTITKKFFCDFESAKMLCEFTNTTNAFQDESWDLSNSKGYETVLISW